MTDEQQAIKQIVDWNQHIDRWWKNLTDDERAKLTHFTREKWNQKTSGCIG